MASPRIKINNQPTDTAVVVAPNTTVVIELENTAGVESWQLSCIGTSGSLLPISVVITYTSLFTAELTCEGTPISYLLQSKINNAVDVNGMYRPDYIETAKLVVPTANYNLHLLATGETIEDDSEYGWIKPLNEAIAVADLGGGGGGGGFTAAGDLSGSEVYQTVVGIRNKPVSATEPVLNDVLKFDGASWIPAAAPSGFTAGGDLSGSSTSQSVIGLRGISVNSLASAPTNGQVLQYSSASSSWTPVASSTFFTAGSDLSGTATSQSVVKITGLSGTIQQTCATRTVTSTTNAWYTESMCPRVNTTNATPTNIIVLSTALNNVMSLDVIVVAKKSDNSAAGTWKISGTYRNAAGLVSTVGTLQISGFADEAISCTVAISGSNLQIQATGLAGSSYFWTATYQTLRIA